MKKLTLYIILVFFIISFLCSTTTLSASLAALHLWLETLVPSFLFPLIIIRLLAPYHLLQPILKPFDRLFQLLFKLNSYAMECILTSFFLGFPSSSLFLEERAKENHFTHKQYERLLYCVFLASPNFILLSLSVLYPNQLTRTLLLVQILSILFLLFCTRKTSLIMQATTKVIAFHALLKDSIRKSFEILFMILAYLLMVYVCIDLLCIVFPTIIKTPLKLLSEFSSGCFYLPELKMSLRTQLMLTSFILSYGGLCVHMQISSLLDKRYFSYINFMKYRLLHIVMALLLTYCLVS